MKLYNKRDDYTKGTASIVSKRQERNVFLTIFAIYYKGSTDFTAGVREILAPELTSIANDFIAIGNRVTAVEKQLKWIEVS